MTNWYDYRWACSACKAVVYREISVCRRCGCRNIERLVNSPELVEQLKSGEISVRTWGPLDVIREGETVKAKPQKNNDDLDDLINNLLGD